MAWKKHLTQEEKSAYHEKKQSEMSELFQRIDEGVKEVFTSEKYQEYLRFMAKFTNYSARNCMLIAMQKPDATLVAAYGKWKQLGRQVSKGETGIRILAPMPYKRKQDEQSEEEESEETEGIAFKAVSVFDVSQTSGAELPSFLDELHGEIPAEQKKAILTALQKTVGIPIAFEDIQGTAKGYYSASENRIVIRTGMSDAQTLKTVFHECTHKLLHDPELKLPTVQASRSEKEVQAESVAFIVAERFGLDISDYSFPYIASWSQGKTLETLHKVLTEIQSAAKILTNAVETGLQALQEEQAETEEESPVFCDISM
ncbi:MAG: ssDNA-binding domain-containing protein [Oscillospiraceae bacterium]|nr:ssDNA-binding domain-containing protein [Oscillospiraceae bacterium]